MLSCVVVLPYGLAIMSIAAPLMITPGLSLVALVAWWLGCLYMNSHGYQFAAAVFALVAPIIAFSFLTHWFTIDAGFHFYLFATGVLGFALLRPELWLTRAMFMFLGVAGITFSEVMWRGDSVHHVYPAWIVDVFLGINIATTVLVLYAVARFDLHYYERERQRNVALLAAAQVAAQTDALTEVYNRRGISPVLSSVARRSDYALALVDLDRFKLINDRLGHGAGDVVLANAARTLVRSVGDSGTVARWGGEEFLVVLPGLSLTDADAVMEKARDEMEAEYGAPESLARVTISVGLAHAPRYSGKEEVIRLADANLYEAKSSGRNVVVSARLAEPEE